MNPKNLLLAAGAGSALAVNGPSAAEAVVALIVFYLAGGDRAKIQLNSAKEWLAAHNTAVMTVLFLALGMNLMAKGIPPLT